SPLRPSFLVGHSRHVLVPRSHWLPLDCEETLEGPLRRRDTVRSFLRSTRSSLRRPLGRRRPPAALLPLMFWPCLIRYFRSRGDIHHGGGQRLAQRCPF